jgi:signal peptidase II
MVEKFISRYKFELWFWGVALVIIFLDQLLKGLILRFQPQWGLNILTIHLIKYTGAGFVILKSQTLFLGIVSLCAALIILFNYKKIDRAYIPQVFFGLFLGGIIGNLIDRLFRGFVVDFLDLSFWPAFNLADACITISIIAVVIWYWKKRE